MNRKELRESLSTYLVPALKDRGFMGPKTISGNKLLHEFQRSSLKDKQCIFIQLEKYKGTCFVLNLEHYAMDQERLYTARVQAKKGSGLKSWFCSEVGLIKGFFKQKQLSSESAIRFCVKLLPEIDVWFVSHKETNNIINVPVPIKVMKDVFNKPNNCVNSDG